MPTLQIHLLGDFQLVVETSPSQAVNQPRLQSLLAYLLLHRHAPQPRHHLAFTFWPEVSESQARNNLRQMLHQLRHALPDADRFLRADVNTVQWRAEALVHLDVAEFDAAVAQIEAIERNSDPHVVRQALQQAVDLYAGDLLPSCYDDWITPERDRLRQQCRSVLSQLVNLLEESRDYVSALAYGQRLLRLDPWNEDVYLCLMRLHALSNDRASALRAYHECVTVLRRELDVEPGSKLQAAYEQLLRLDTYNATQPIQSAVFSVSTPFIGRQLAWKQLRATWQTALGGRSSFALILGEAGIGKTRLAEEILGWASQQGLATARTRAYAAEGRLSYSSIAEWLRSGPIASALARLELVWLSEIARLLPELLTKYRDLAHPGPLTEFWQRQRFFEALARGVLAGNCPLVLQIDDLQWCDQETLEWLHFLLRFAPTSPLLIVGTARVEEMAANPALTTLLGSIRSTDQLIEIPIAPLDAAETTKLAAGVIGHELDLAHAVRLFKETEGNPLFALEMVRAQFAPVVSPAGRGAEAPLPDPHNANAPFVLPPKVYAVIAARLTQLSPLAYELVGVAATIGRAFTLDVLAHACGQVEDSLVNALDELWQRRIIREQGINAYDFSHDKLREVAYVELSPMQRRKLHQRVAQALESVYAADLDSFSAQISAHFEQAGLPAQGMHYYQRAAAVAQRLYANEEAISLFNKGLALLQRLPSSLARDERELELQTALGVSLVAARGYAAQEVSDVYRRALALGRELGQPPLPPVLRALALAHVTRAELRQAHELGAQLLDLAQRDQAPVLTVEAHYVLGVTLFWLGSFVPAREHLEQAIDSYDAQQSRTHIALYSQDPKAVCLSRLAFDLWFLGHPERAVQTSREALAFADELAHPLSRTYAAYFDLQICVHRGAPDEALARAEGVMALCREFQLGYWLPPATVLHGWAQAELGSYNAGTAEMRAGMAAFRAIGAEYMQSYFQAMLAEQCGKVGDVEAGLALLAEALAAAEKSDEHWCEAELYRTQGELLLLRGQQIEAEAALRRAVDIARTQQARSLELRASVGLARLRRIQGEYSEAQRLLSPIFNWFSEGLDTRDLRQAKSLLDELAR